MRRALAPQFDAQIGQAIFDAAPIGMILVARSGRFLRANAAFCAFIGYTERELKARTVRDVTHPDDRGKTERRIRNLWSKGRDSGFLEKRYVHKSGRVVWGQVEGGIAWQGGRPGAFSVAYVLDITKRKAAEDALREGQERFRVALQGSAVTVFSQDRNLHYTWVSNPAPGFNVDGVLGKRDDEIYAPEDAAVFMAIKRRVMASGVGRRDEVVTHRPAASGGDIVHDMTTEPLRDGKGRIVGVVCAATDITERKRMESALSHERNLYKDLVDSQPAGVYRLRVTAAREWVDNEWVARLATNYAIEMASDLFCGILGITQAQRKADATIVAKRIHPEDRPDFISRNVEAMNTLKPFKWEGRILRRREVRWVDFVAVPRPLANGDVIWTGILRDITERKQAQQAQQESDTRYRSLFEQAADSIVVFDPKTTRILEFNDAACRRLGYTRDEFAKLKVSDLDIIESRADVVRHSHRVMAEGQRVFETRHRTRSGALLDVEVWPKAIVLGGKTVMLAIWRDITERKRLEDTLKALNAELEAKVRERTSRLRALAVELTQVEHMERRRIADVLHEDLQQRLVAMKYRLHHLKERHTDAMTVRDAEWLLGELQHSVEISRGLTTQLRPPVLYELGLVPAFEWMAKDMHARFGCRIDVAGVKTFHLSSNTLKAFAFEAVRELLMNVVKHSGVRRASIRMAWRGQNKIAIEVSDKGKGYDATPPQHAASFGLFSIRERIEAFGGRFDITGRSGKGTRAVLILPARPSAVSP